MEFKLKEIEEIYHAALEKKAGPERSTYLDAACRDDAALRKQIEALLKANEQAADFLENPGLGIDISLDESPLSEGPGTVIGRYKLLEKIGEGGMAVVYMAEQAEPIRRKVALKIIKLGMDTKSVIARFEAERQALAMMDHPNIAKVLDAGATETGRPYFVMELVTGLSITEYCDKNNLITKDRLALFIQVCNAVQHAHQKGIIHRDIKPTNVMVEHHDGKPVPKVIDFGIAKATNQRLTEKTLFTRYAHIIGTPAYMSPEQADLGDMDVDTRSDIYSLGVLLYELLTGTTPFSEEELRKSGYLEMQRVIREQEPTKPSTKLNTLGETLTDVAKHRSATPDVLRKVIHGDLDWIVMKSLEKGRARRYSTATELGVDVQRYLNGEPVLAASPTSIYRIHKFVRRHRVGVIAIILVTVALLMGLSLASLGFIQARTQYQRAEANLDAATENLREIMRLEWVAPSGYSYSEELRLDLITFEKAQAFLQKVVKQRGSNPETRLEIARNYRIMGELHACLEQNDQAETAFLQSINVMDELVEDFPTNNDFQRELAYSKSGLAVVLRHLGREQEASSIHNDSLTLLNSLPNPIQFGIPSNLGMIVNSKCEDSYPCISSDGLLMFLQSKRTGGIGNFDIWISIRSTTSEPWNEPTNLGPPVNTRSSECSPCISNDGLSLFFSSHRGRGLGESDLWMSKRKTSDSTWSESINLGDPVNSPFQEFCPHISSDSLTLFFVSNRPKGEGGFDLWVAVRKTCDDAWGIPENLGANINSPFRDIDPCLSADGLVLFFASNRPGGFGCGNDIWLAKRSSIHEPFGYPTVLGPPVNNPAENHTPFLSSDGHTLYFTCDFNHSSNIRFTSVVNMAESDGVGYLTDLWQVPVLSLVSKPIADDDKTWGIKLMKKGNGKEVMSDDNH